MDFSANQMKFSHLKFFLEICSGNANAAYKILGIFFIKY